jgi:hypothetical protein
MGSSSFIKVIALCIIFLTKQTTLKIEFYNSSYDWNTKQCYEGLRLKWQKKLISNLCLGFDTIEIMKNETLCACVKIWGFVLLSELKFGLDEN